jgi:hypothetical protein
MNNMWLLSAIVNHDHPQMSSSWFAIQVAFSQAEKGVAGNFGIFTLWTVLLDVNL